MNSPGPAAAVQVRGEVLSVRRQGAYHVLALAAPGVAERARPGQFAALAIGSGETSMLLRRCFSIHGLDQYGVLGGSMELVISVVGPGTRWLADRRRGDSVSVLAPLGRPFALPLDPVSCVLVGGGYGSAPLFMLADQLRERGCRVDMVLGAADEERLFGTLQARRLANALHVTTEDGSAGARGRVTDALERVLAERQVDVVYACGPMGMLRAVAELAAAHGAHSQCAVEEAMACGVGVCMSCVLPVVGDDGQTRMVRSCTDGPVFFGDRVRWAEVGTVPADCLGTPRA